MDGLSLIKTCPDDRLHEFLHRIADGICGRNGAEVARFVPSVWADEATFLRVSRAWTEYLQTAINSRDKSELSDVGENQRKVINECIETRRGELRSGLIQAILSSSGEPVLKDFDWQVKMVLSSDKMQALNEPLLNLDLSLGKKTGAENGQKESASVSLEMNRDELSKLIKCLEEAQLALQRSSTK